VIKDEALQRVKEERNIIHTVHRRKVNRIGHILCGNCLLKYVIERKVKGKNRSDGKMRKER
jgi:hypothetical protein